MINYILITFFLLFYGYLVCKNTKTGIYLIILFLPSYLIRFKVGPVPFTLLEGMILILFFCWLFKVYKSGGKLNLNIFKPSGLNPLPKIFRLPIILFLVAATLAAFLSDNRIAALGTWKAYFIEPLLFFIVLIYSIKESKEIKNIIYCLEILVIAIGIFAFIQKLTGALIPNPYWADELTRRVTTFFGYPNANSLLLAPIFILTIGNLLGDKKNYLTIINSAAIILGAATIVWTQSTGAFIGIVAGIFFLLIYFQRTRIISIIFLIIFLYLSIASPLSPFDLSQLSPQQLGLDATSLQIRINQWQETFELLKDHPLLGAGLANYQNMIKPYHQYGFIEMFLYPHNFFLNFWVETGLLGLFAIIWLLIVFFIYSLKKIKESVEPFISLTIAGSMVTLLIHGLVDVPYFKNDLAILFWVIIGLIIVNNNKISINKT